MKRIWSAVPLALLLVFVAGTGAQDKKSEAHLRAVRGSVLDRDDNPVPASVVYLKNLKTQAVKTYIADDTGHYRFSGLDPNVDYEIHAEHADLRSANHTVSSFDSRKDVVITLRLKKKKSTK